MAAILERTPRSVTVRLSSTRWNRMLELEKTYRLARIIKRSMAQVVSEPALSKDETIKTLRAL